MKAEGPEEFSIHSWATMGWFRMLGPSKLFLIKATYSQVPLSLGCMSCLSAASIRPSCTGSAQAVGCLCLQQAVGSSREKPQVSIRNWMESL